MRSLPALLLFLAPLAAQAQGAGPVAMGAVAGRGPILDEAAFEKAGEVSIGLVPQVIATPKAPAPSVTSVRVRAVRNADHAGFLVEWSDPTADLRTAIGGFGDMAAIAFPANGDAAAPPAPFMGNPGGLVRILQWRADWQTDLDRGPISIKELYPNAYAADFHHEDHLPAAQAAKYRGAAGAGNLMSLPHGSSVQDLMAEGFGSLTPRPEQRAKGSARHDGSGWHVVITRPLADKGTAGAPLAPGASTQLAFAVWNGSEGEVGPRKAWFGWVPLEIAP